MRGFSFTIIYTVDHNILHQYRLGNRVQLLALISLTPDADSINNETNRGIFLLLQVMSVLSVFSREIFNSLCAFVIFRLAPLTSRYLPLCQEEEEQNENEIKLARLYHAIY